MSVFKTLQSLQRHRTSAHAISTPGTQWVTTNGVCMGCLKLFHTKLRLHRHLQYTHAGLTSCQPSIAAKYPPINVPIVATEYSKKSGIKSDKAMRNSDCDDARAPVLQLSGPLIPQVNVAKPDAIKPDVGQIVGAADDDKSVKPHKIVTQLCQHIYITTVVVLDMYSGRKRPGCSQTSPR